MGCILAFDDLWTFFYATWFIIIYAYQHRNDIGEETSMKHIKVNPDMISNREFDRDRFKK